MRNPLRADSNARTIATGQVIYCDRGTDALVRGSRPQKVFLRYRPREVWALVRESRRLALLPPDMKTEPKLR